MACTGAFLGSDHPTFTAKDPRLRATLAQARAVTDPAENSKLAKNAEGGWRLWAKDDALAAAILGVAAGRRDGRNGRAGATPGCPETAISALAVSPRRDIVSWHPYQGEHRTRLESLP